MTILTEENTKDPTKWRLRGNHDRQPVRIDKIKHYDRGWRVDGFTWNQGEEGEENKGWAFDYTVNNDGTYPQNHDYDLIPAPDPDPPAKLFSVAAALVVGLRLVPDTEAMRGEAVILRDWIVPSGIAPGRAIRRQYPEFPIQNGHAAELKRNGWPWFLAKWEAYFGMRYLEFYKGNPK